jgi:hypothetical protein
MPQPWQTLAFLNKHPRDAFVRFVEKTHTYYIRGKSEGYISTTGFVHAFFPHFDADAVIKQMMASPNWPKSKYFGKTAEEIATEWSTSGAESSGKGTNMHLAIEQWLNGATDLIDPTVIETDEWRYFQNFWRDYYEKLEPYRMEWEVFDEEHKLSGSIDAVFKNKEDGTYVIYDWKRSKEIKTKAYKGEAGYAPLDHLENVNYWHYTMQLNVYKWFLETHYGLKISGLYLIILHPNNNNYVRYQLNILDEEVQAMLECRLAAVEEGKGNPIVLPGETCLLED